MAGPSTSPPADEPYQWCIEGPRICNMDPDLMREFTAVVRCNRDGVAFPFTSDLESVMRQHQCTQEHGSKEDLETRKDGSFCSQSTAAVFPQIPPITLQIDDGTGPRAPLNLQTLLDAAFAIAQSSHGRIDNRGTWLLKLDIIFMVKNPLGETPQLELVNGTSKVDKDPEERHSSNIPPFSFKFPKNAMVLENKQLEDSGMSDLASCYHGKHKKGKQSEEDKESSMRDEIIKLWTVTMDDKRAPTGGGDGGAGAGRGGHGDAGDGCGHGGAGDGCGHGGVGDGCGHGGAGDGCGHGGAGDGGPHGGAGDIYGGGHGSFGGGVGVVEEDEETKGVVEGDEAGDSAGELVKHKREVEVLMEITQATCNEMVEEFKKISKMFNEFKKLAYGGAGGAVGDP